ncbi:unnamed protein product [Cyprideis torosa]|uniref:Uncharacterized protein n=1 Tax=Cyprideis torosa TaxID=163714 RepID=A0A7R8WPP7_9CRUS|nr:unnamed protein product [Cyprideis torosa]CAG0901784.1 unnamed protein product [Cyprideis torosa]
MGAHSKYNWLDSEAVIHGPPKKVLFTCYEIGHPWTPSCSAAALEAFWNIAQESIKMYGVLYTIAHFSRGDGKVWDRKKVLCTLKNILQSTLFLSFNGFSFIGALCCSRNILGHINVLSSSFMPAWIANFMSIMIEKPERRTALALYVTNVGLETLVLMAGDRGFKAPLPGLDVAVFGIGLAVALRLFLKNPNNMKGILGVIIRKVLNPFPTLNASDPSDSSCGNHPGPCWKFISQLTTCLLRRVSGRTVASHVTVAGLAAAPSLLVYRSQAVAFYTLLKGLEVLIADGVNSGRIPSVPLFVPLLYATSCSLLCHTAVMEPHNLKPSYWVFLNRITHNRIAEMNRHMLDFFGFDSARLDPDYWPNYASGALSSKFVNFLIHQNFVQET